MMKGQQQRSRQGRLVFEDKKVDVAYPLVVDYNKKETGIKKR